MVQAVVQFALYDWRKEIMKMYELDESIKQRVMEMDKSQTPPGRDGSNSDSDAGKKEYTAKTITPKKVVKHAEKILNKVFNKKQGVSEMRDRRDAYQRDYDSSQTGFGRQHREIDDEANLMYVYDDGVGRVKQRMISNHEERSAHQEGYRQTPEDALRIHGIIRSKFKPGKWVQKQGTQWVEVHPFGNSEDVAESATAGATSAANVSVGVVYKNKPVKQPKNKDGTAKNALDIDVNLMTGGSIKR